MVRKIYVEKQYSDKEFDKDAHGKNFPANWFSKPIKGSTDCYWIDEAGNERVLFKFRKNAIKGRGLNLPRVREIYENFTKPRRMEKGFFQKRHKPKSYEYRSLKSKLSGFYDRPTYHQSKYFRTRSVCRATRFTRDHPELWDEVVPFFNKIGKLYKKLAPIPYERQITAIKKVPKDMRIGNSPFTTITSNYNWRTATHKDRGDYKEGLGNLTILGDHGFKGGYVGFPQFKVCVDMKPKDFLIMDVHQWHCNTPLKADANNVRLSFVCYFRHNMMYCNKKTTVKGEKLYYRRGSKGRSNLRSKKLATYPRRSRRKSRKSFKRKRRRRSSRRSVKKCK